MHPNIREFVEEVRDRYPRRFCGAAVLEVGARNVNGSVRDLFEDCDCIGLDLVPGEGVDLVCHAREFVRPGEFDTVISTEALEHDRHWRDSLRQMAENLTPGGLLVVTCAGPGRQEHGTTEHEPDDSPATNDYYQNLRIADVAPVLPCDEFDRLRLAYERDRQDLVCWGVKRK